MYGIVVFTGLCELGGKKSGRRRRRRRRKVCLITKDGRVERIKKSNQ